MFRLSKPLACDLLCDRFSSAFGHSIHRYSFRFEILALDDVFCSSSSLSSSSCQLTRSTLDAMSLKYSTMTRLADTFSRINGFCVSVWRVAAAFKRISNFRCTWYESESSVATQCSHSILNARKEWYKLIDGMGPMGIVTNCTRSVIFSKFLWFSDGNKNAGWPITWSRLPMAAQSRTNDKRKQKSKISTSHTTPTHKVQRE